MVNEESTRTDGSTNSNRGASRVTEVVGVFVEAGELRQAVEDLLASGFEREKLGLLAAEPAVLESLGDLYIAANRSVDDPGGPRTAFVAKQSVGDAVHGIFGALFFVGTTAATGAAVASAAVFGGALLAATAGTAALGAVGGIMALIIHKSDAEYLEEQIDQGHLLLFVRTRDQRETAQAKDILSRRSAFAVRTCIVANGGSAPRSGEQPA
jgi:hypothetical protein